MFNWFKKKEPEKFTTSVRPKNETLLKLAIGEMDLFEEYICYEHVNWAYGYLGSSETVSPHDRVLNKHIVVLTGAAVKYLDDLDVPNE